MEYKEYEIRPLEDSIPCKILQGIRVVELTEHVAGSMCGRMLTDYGADVIKIERPSGDPWRYVGANSCCPIDRDENPLFDVLNANKKSVVLDLKTQEGLNTMDKLVQKADIFLSNNRLKSLIKMGLDPETMREKYPRIIYGLITGYGLEGDERDEPGFDSACFWGRSGFMRDMPIEVEGGYPLPSPTAVGDSTAGALLLTGLLTALYQREKTGKGDFVTVSLLSTAMFAFNSMMVMTQPRYGRPYPMKRDEIKPYVGAYKARDGEWVQFAISNYKRHSAVFMKALGLDAMAEDPRFATEESARGYWGEMVRAFEEQFLRKDADEWVDIIRGLDITCCKLPHFSDLSNDKQLWANHYLQDYVFRNNAHCVMPCPPVRFGSTGGMYLGLAPALGENTEEVLREIEEEGR